MNASSRVVWHHLAAVVLLLGSLSASPARSQTYATPIPVGAAMEDFGLRALDVDTGQLTKLTWLSDYVGPQVPSGQPKRLLVLNYFAIWCKPCLAELMLLSRLQARYAGHGLQVLAVNYRRANEPLADTLSAVRHWLPQGGLGFPLLFDRYTDRPQLLYLGGSTKLPCSVLIDAAGRVTARLHGDEITGLEQTVRAQLGLPIEANGASP